MSLKNNRYNGENTEGREKYGRTEGSFSSGRASFNDNNAFRSSFGNSRSFGGARRSSFGAGANTNRGRGFRSNGASTFSNDVIVKIFCEEGCKISKATNDSAGYDVSAAESLEMKPWSVAKIRTGVFVNMTFKSVMLVCSRSGLAAEGVFVLNAPGIIDADYEKEIYVVLANFSEKIVSIEKGDRIAQVLFQRTSNIKLDFVENAEELSSSSSRGGFGSTGR